MNLFVHKRVAGNGASFKGENVVKFLFCCVDMRLLAASYDHAVLHMVEDALLEAIQGNVRICEQAGQAAPVSPQHPHRMLLSSLLSE